MGGKVSADQKVEVGLLDGESWADPGQRFPSVKCPGIKPFRASCTFGRGRIYFNSIDRRGIGVTMCKRPFIQSILKVIDELSLPWIG